MIFLEIKKFSEEERKEHVNNWERSGMNITQYAKSCNISRKTMSEWMILGTEEKVIFDEMLEVEGK